MVKQVISSMASDGMTQAQLIGKQQMSKVTDAMVQCWTDSEAADELLD